MPVTARLSKHFYDRLGDQATHELVEWFNTVDLAIRTDIRAMNESQAARWAEWREEWRQQRAEDRATWERERNEAERARKEANAKWERERARWEETWKRLQAESDARWAAERMAIAKEIREAKHQALVLITLQWALTLTAILPLYLK